MKEATYLYGCIGDCLCGHFAIHPEFGCDRWAFRGLFFMPSVGLRVRWPLGYIDVPLCR